MCSLVRMKKQKRMLPRHLPRMYLRVMFFLFQAHHIKEFSYNIYNISGLNSLLLQNREVQEFLGAKLLCFRIR